MGAWQNTEYHHDETSSTPNSQTIDGIPRSQFCVEDIDFIPVSIPLSQKILSMISEIENLFGSDKQNQNAPNYCKTIKNRLEHFNSIQANIIEQKYKNIGEILKDIDAVWKSMYQLTDNQTNQNKQHEPKSDFITFAAGIESEFYNLWDEFEKILITQGYLKENNEKYPAFLPNQQQKKEKKERKEKEEKEENKKKIEHKTKAICNEDNEGFQDLKYWLTNIVKLPQYYDLFILNGFEDLTFVVGIIRENDLKEMGINKVGHRRKILFEADSPDHRKRRLEINDESDNNIDIETDGYNAQQPPKKKRRMII